MKLGALKKVKADSRILPLLQGASTYRELKFVESHGLGWGSAVHEQTAVVYYDDCNDAASCLAHELLHLIVQGKGVRQMTDQVVSDDRLDRRVRFLRWTLNNELQHHKIFRRFVAAGFDSKEFYHDDDAEIGEHFAEEVAGLGGEVVRAVKLYLSILAPGGLLTKAERDDYEKQLMSIEGGRYRAALMEVKAAIQEWSRSTTYDIESCVRRICRAAFGDGEIWLGYSETFPQDGFFVGA
jgi:hypothetical protein